jgi:DNA repair exonuclease SbcCD ATPase subunit
MIPIELTLENFTCHVKSVIDFTQFDAAVVVGKATNNTRKANQVGKSKIFSGITYALFNEVGVDKIDSIIRDDSDKTRVSFVFMVGGDTYKVDRSRGRKAGSADLRLFRKNDVDWEDLTERTTSGTEKTLAKILKINYRAFSNSIHFRQADLSGLATLTPSERKNLLREALQLTVYGQLEKLTKKRAGKIAETEIYTKAKLGTYSEVDARFSTRMSDINVVAGDIVSSLAKIEVQKKKVELIQEDWKASREEMLKFKSSVEMFLDKVKNTNASLILIKSKKDNAYKKLDSIRQTTQAKLDSIISMKATLADLESKNTVDVFALSTQLEETTRQILEHRASLKSIEEKMAEWSVPLPNGPECKHCRQALTAEHRESCQKDLQKKTQDAQDQYNKILETIVELKKRGLDLSQQHGKVVSLQHNIDTLKKDIQFSIKEVDIQKESYLEYKDQYSTLKGELEQIETEIALLEAQRSNYDTSRYSELNSIIFSKETAWALADKELQLLNTEQANLVAEERSYKKQLLELDEAKTVRDTLVNEIKKIEKELLLHAKVAQAFGSKGIPSLIIHNILDDLQLYANNIVGQVKPGLQLQFEIDRENKKGEQTDTLDINYIINGRQREYGLLSGSQMFIISLALRIGLSTVIQKIFGVDIKFLMLDEVDSSLDDESLDAFLDLIKILQKEYKVVLITHNKTVKDRFSHAILVEQDTNGNSYAKIVSSW